MASKYEIESEPQEHSLNNTINTTPLVDIMLVLLIIFLITIPVIRNLVPLTLPNAVNIPTQTKPSDIVIAVDAKGQVYWNHDLVPDEQTLISKVAAAAVVKPQPKIEIRGDRNVQYQSIGRVLYAVQRGGIVKVNFITQPDSSTLAKYLRMAH